MIKVKDWKKFQHFKDRRPPWIKVYREILDDPDWHELDGNSAKVLLMLWLIASEDPNQEGGLPCLRKLSFRLRMTEHQLSSAISKLSHWLIQDDITTISSRYQDDAPETETEGEGETETDTLSSSKQLDGGSRPALTAKNGVPYTQIINHLNAVAGTFYKPTTVNTKNRIKARWQEGHRLDDFLAVIDHKCEEWLGDEKMGKFLRPETLFGPKFESYLVSAKAAGVGVKPKLRWHK